MSFDSERRAHASDPNAQENAKCRNEISLTENAPCEGGLHRPSGLRRGQDDQRQEAPHILVDTQGLLMHAIVHAADIQDRDGGATLMATLFGAVPFLSRLFADGGYQGPQFKTAMERISRGREVEIVKRSDQAKAFVVLPKRWIGERTLAWLGRCRRLAKDWECLNRKAPSSPPRDQIIQCYPECPAHWVA